MPNSKIKSRTFRRVFVKTPGNKNVTHYKRRKPSKAVCGQCKMPLVGVPQVIPTEMAKLPRTARRPERPYGGMFCSACTRIVLQRQARGVA